MNSTMEIIGEKMSETTLFLLTLIGVLVPANAFLWIVEKRSKTRKPVSETTFYKQRQKTNQEDFFLRTNRLQSWQENIYANNGKKLLPESNSNDGKVMPVQKSGRVKILEQYLKQI